MAFCYWQPFDTLIRGEKNPADCLAVDDVKGVLRDAELDVRKHWRTKKKSFNKERVNLSVL